MSLLTPLIHAQEFDIIPLLKDIEKGRREEVLGKLPGLIKQYPNSSNILFLEGVLTENGQQAVAVYNKLIKKYPGSKYADAALYRIYTYYYALGMYSFAKIYLDRLNKDYPGSPYTGIAQKNIPSKDKVLIDTRNGKPDSVKKDSFSDAEKNIEKIFYSIQAGAFTVLANSQSLKKNLEDAGYYSAIIDKNVAGTDFHVVYAGRYNTEDEAKKYLQIINSKFNLSGRVVKISLP